MSDAYKSNQKFLISRSCVVLGPSVFGSEKDVWVSPRLTDTVLLVAGWTIGGEEVMIIGVKRNRRCMDRFLGIKVIS